MFICLSKRIEMKTQLYRDLLDINNALFAAERKLPNEGDSNEAYVRRSLYKLRTELGSIQRFCANAGLLDAETYDTHQ
jgi:hypothetical protein